MSSPDLEPDNIKFLAGNRVYLRLLERRDLGIFCKWANDPVSRNLTGDRVPHGMDGLQAWFDSIRGDQTRMRFILCLNESDEPIGSAALLRIDPYVRSASLDMAIGEKKYWGKGYATESTLLLLDYAYGTLGLHRIQIDVFAFNPRALAVYERIGFRRDGVLRDAHYSNHRFQDVVVLSLLADEFRALHHPQRS